MNVYKNYIMKTLGVLNQIIENHIYMKLTCLRGDIYMYTY